MPSAQVGRRCVPRRGEHEAAQPVAHVGFDLGLGPAGLLEVLDVELLVAGDRPHHRAWDASSDGGENGTDSPATAVNTSGRSSAEFQAIGAPQSWPTIDRRLESERGHEADVVGDEAHHAIVLDRQRLRRAAVAAHVDRHRPVAGLGERRELVAPRVPRLGEAVHEQDQRAVAGFHAVDPALADLHQVRPATGG